MSVRSELEYLIKTTMKNDGGNHGVQLVSERYGTCFKYLVQKLIINEETITSGLEILAGEILLGEGKLSHVLVLLLFCTELDKYCNMKKYPWYSSEMLIEIIVGILLKVDFIPPTTLYSFKICSILQFHLL